MKVSSSSVTRQIVKFKIRTQRKIISVKICWQKYSGESSLVLSLLRSCHQLQDVSGWKKYIHKDAALQHWIDQNSLQKLSILYNILSIIFKISSIFRVFIEFYEWMSPDQGRLTVWKHWRLGKWFASANGKPVLTSHDHFQPIRGRYFISRAFLTNLVTTLQLTPKINSQTKQLSFSQQRV